jgi:hypothetical protein
MTAPSSDRELQSWVADWTAPAEHRDVPEAVRRHVVRRGRLLLIWWVTEWLFAAAVFAFLLHRTITQADPIERAFMGVLAAMTVAMLGFVSWNWRGSLRASVEATSTVIELSFERARRLRRAIRAGWIVLATEAVVFTPWVWYRVTRTGSVSDGPVWPWVLLVGMLLLGLVYLLGLRAWADREMRAVEALRREFQDV